VFPRESEALTVTINHVEVSQETIYSEPVPILEFKLLLQIKLQLLKSIELDVALKTIVCNATHVEVLAIISITGGV
jgi:hypothetical protein